MKPSRFTLLAVMALTACQTYQPKINTSNDTKTLKPADDTTLIISYEAGKKESALQAISNLQGKIIYDYKSFNMLAVGFYNGDIETIKKRLETQPAILSVSRDYMQHTLK